MCQNTRYFCFVFADVLCSTECSSAPINQGAKLLKTSYAKATIQVPKWTRFVQWGVKQLAETENFWEWPATVFILVVRFVFECVFPTSGEVFGAYSTHDDYLKECWQGTQMPLNGLYQSLELHFIVAHDLKKCSYFILWRKCKVTAGMLTYWTVGSNFSATHSHVTKQLCGSFLFNVYSIILLFSSSTQNEKSYYFDNFSFVQHFLRV